MAMLERFAGAAGTGTLPVVPPLAINLALPVSTKRTGDRTQTPASTSPQNTGGRQAWIDMARGLAVVLVVLFHVTIGHYYLMEWADGAIIARWDRINQILSIIRLPLLFALSGMLASGKIRRGFTGGKAIEGAATNYYLYAVWLGLYGLFVLAIPDGFPAPHKVASLDLWIAQLWAPNTYLWYVFSLACYILAFTALRRVPAWAMLSGLYLVHLLAASIWSVESALWTRAIAYALFFAMGVYGGQALRYLARSPLATLGTALASYLVYQQIGMTKLMTVDTLGPVDATLLVTLYTCMGLTAVGIIGILARIEPFARFGSYIGQHTLGIYVLHIPMATLLNLIVLVPLAGLGAVVSAHPALHMAYPVIASALVVVACILTERAISRTRWGGLLFKLPAPLARQCATVRASLASPGTESAPVAAQRS